MTNKIIYLKPVTYQQLLFTFRFTRFVEVAFDIEFREESEEQNSMSTDVIRKLPREITIIIKDELESVNHDANELKHL